MLQYLYSQSLHHKYLLLAPAQSLLNINSLPLEDYKKKSRKKLITRNMNWITEDKVYVYDIYF